MSIPVRRMQCSSRLLTTSLQFIGVMDGFPGAPAQGKICINWLEQLLFIHIGDVKEIRAGSNESPIVCLRHQVMVTDRPYTGVGARVTLDIV